MQIIPAKNKHPHAKYNVEISDSRLFVEAAARQQSNEKLETSSNFNVKVENYYVHEQCKHKIPFHLILPYSTQTPTILPLYTTRCFVTKSPNITLNKFNCVSFTKPIQGKQKKKNQLLT